MNKDPNIVIYFAHLDIGRSEINRALRESVRNIPQVEFRDLLEFYPDFFINVSAEQEILGKSDLIVFQFPVYWYSFPAIFKHFLDTVFVRGFAYGKGGTKLQGKDFLLVASTGAESKEYQTGGSHHYPFNELLRPIEQTARFCGMNFLPPIVLHGGYSASKEVISEHADTYRNFLLDYKPIIRSASG